MIRTGSADEREYDGRIRTRSASFRYATHHGARLSTATPASRNRKRETADSAKVSIRIASCVQTAREGPRAWGRATAPAAGARIPDAYRQRTIPPPMMLSSSDAPVVIRKTCCSRRLSSPLAVEKDDGQTAHAAVMVICGAGDGYSGPADTNNKFEQRQRQQLEHVEVEPRLKAIV